MGKLPLYKQIQADIKKQIAFGSLKPGDRIPSETDLARKYFVSQITSKNALNGLVDEGYLYRIQGKGTFVTNSLADSEADSVPSADSTIFKPSFKGIIGFLVPAMVTKVSQTLLNHMERFISQADYQMVFHITRESITDEAFTINLLRNNGAKGIIVFPVIDEVYNETILRTALDKYPLVLVDRYFKNINVNSVTSDNMDAMYEATNYLIQNHHKNIAILSPKITNTAVEDRVAGFEKCCFDNDLPINQNDWCILDYDINETDYTFTAIESFFLKKKYITAAICINAEIAQCAYYVLQKMGKCIPTNFELISFDQPYLNGVSYIAQDEEDICKKAIDLLICQINGDYNTSHIEVPAKFINLKSASPDLPPYHLLYVLNK